MDFGNINTSEWYELRLVLSCEKLRDSLKKIIKKAREPHDLLAKLLA